MADEINVLYVDDDVYLHEPFKIFLELTGGMSVTAVSSPLKAISLLDGAAYDAIVSDYQMPEMDGITFLKTIRGRGNDLPFVLFTGRGREEVVIEALNEGADHYLQKGGDPQSQFAMLVHMLRLSVETRRQRQALNVLRKRLESFINNTSDAISIFDADGKVLTVNPAFERMYGWTAGELSGNMPLQIPGDDADRVRRIADQVASTREAAHYSSTRQRKDGSRIEADITLSAITDDEGRVTGFASISKDITELVEVMNAITSIKEEFRVILGTIGDAVISTDDRGIVRYLNPTAERMLDITLDEAVGQDINKIVNLVNEGSRRKVEIPSERVIRDGRMAGLANHAVIISGSGKEFFVSDLAAPLRDEAGRLMGTVVVFRDITSEKLSERRASAINSATRLLFHASGLNETMNKVLTSICTELRFDAGIIWGVDISRERLTLLARWASGTMKFNNSEHYISEKAFMPGEDLPGMVWRGANTILLADTGNQGDDGLASLLRRDGIASVYALPIFDEDALVRGVLLLAGRLKNELDSRTLSTLHDIGILAGQFMARHEN